MFLDTHKVGSLARKKIYPEKKCLENRALLHMIKNRNFAIPSYFSILIHIHLCSILQLAKSHFFIFIIYTQFFKTSLHINDEDT